MKDSMILQPIEVSKIGQYFMTSDGLPFLCMDHTFASLQYWGIQPLAKEAWKICDSEKQKLLASFL